MTIIEPAVWIEIEHAVCNGMTFPEASKKYNIKENTLRVKAKRGKWVTPKIVRAQVSAEIKRTTGATVTKVVADWLAKGEDLRDLSFTKAHDSIKKFKPKAPKNFRELESAVKIARQAAGLETADINVATLIQMNERMENFEDEQPIEDPNVIDGEFEMVPEQGASVALPSAAESPAPEGTDAPASTDPSPQP